MKKPTIYTIAEQCGVSYATVSLVLSGSPLVADKTARKVRAAAKQVGYQPNRLARSLKTGSTRTLGVILPSFVYPYHALMAEKIYLQASLRGYQVQYHLSGNDFAQEERAIQECLNARVDGIILATVFSKSNPQARVENVLNDLISKNYPCVLTSTGFSGAPVVTLDHYAASVIAVRHLVKLGYQQLRLIQLGTTHLDGTTSFPLQTLLSERGFCDALREYGFDEPEKKVLSRYVVKSEVAAKDEINANTELSSLKYIEYEQFFSLGVDMFRQAYGEINDEERIGLVFGHDQLAYSAWQYCREKQLDVPGRIGLVGRGGIQQMLPLTTVRWDYEKYAARLVEVLHRQISLSDPDESATDPLPPWIIERESTAPALDQKRVLTVCTN